MNGFPTFLFPLLLIGPLVMALLIWILEKINIFQPIYAKSPTSHQTKKKTVTFGGIGITLILIIGHTLWQNMTPSVLWVIGIFTSFALLGFIDDFTAYSQRINKGLTPKQKFAAQLVIATLFLALHHLYISPIMAWEWIFYLFLIVGSSNATNLTDGLDGLLAGLSLITLTGFGLLFNQLQLIELRTLCLIIGIATGSFLLFNRHKARIFMGDTGSLALGASFAGLAILSRQPLVLLPFGIVYIIETLSVIIQVFYFKKTNKRLFLMSPLHHHFELMGLSEWKVVLLMWSIGLCGLGLWILN